MTSGSGENPANLKTPAVTEAEVTRERDAAVVEVHQVSKIYTQHMARTLLRERLAALFRGKTSHPFYALRGVSLRVNAGESLGILGPNGAGKSTLLGIISGLCYPDSGSVTVKGSIAALLELGSGFHYDLTGRENVALNASLLGLNRKQLRERFDTIVAFAELEDFIDEPLRTYSSGMVMRLAFSVAVNTNPDILIIDEVLAVGDQRFQEKCVKRIYELKAAGHTLICVSHSGQLIEALCDTGLWLDHGSVVAYGDVHDVVKAYDQSGHAKGASA
ncbi:MAG: ABC transporter ATP-binding protein [Acidobacteriales bacterium]|nr:ABC transporter ATP-binding protein [Terriglobales bacterium]